LETERAYVWPCVTVAGVVNVPRGASLATVTVVEAECVRAPSLAVTVAV
jgi:hypothetical protein